MPVFNEIKAFGKAQASAFIGGLVDYSVMVIAVEVFGHHYITGIILGGIIGAIANYLINRYWSFSGHRVRAIDQIGKFIMVVIGSIILKSFGTTFLTEIVHLDYRISRLLTDAIVSLGFNYTLQRYWVFRKQMI